MRIDLKMEKMSQKALERKSNKPIMEKKRRARINHCLNQLKALILEADNERSRHSKLEKADILEMTVKYLQTFRAYHIHLHQLNQIQQQQQAALGQQRLASAGTASSSPSPPMNLQLSHLALPLQMHQDHFQQQQRTSRQQSNNHLSHLDLSHLNQHRPTTLHTAPSQMSPTWRPW